MDLSGVTPEEFLSTLTGKPSRETLDKIGAALADPNSEIHAFLRSFAEFGRRARDPDAIDWEAYILPPLPEAPDEAAQRTQIQEALGDLHRSYWRPDSPGQLPPSRTIVDAICRRLDWFDALDRAGKLRVYQIAGEEVAALRMQTFATVAQGHTDQATRSSAAHLTKKLAERADCLARLAEAVPELAQAFRLSVDAGRLPAEIAELLDVTEDVAAKYVREAEVEVGIAGQS